MPCCRVRHRLLCCSGYPAATSHQETAACSGRQGPPRQVMGVLHFHACSQQHNCEISLTIVNRTLSYTELNRDYRNDPCTLPVTSRNKCPKPNKMQMQEAHEQYATIVVTAFRTHHTPSFTRYRTQT
jgi:hypothetical protein